MRVLDSKKPAHAKPFGYNLLVQPFIAYLSLTNKVQAIKANEGLNIALPFKAPCPQGVGSLP